MFYFNQFLHIFQISCKKLIILVFFTFRSDMKPCDTKRQVTTQKNKMNPKKIKWYRDMIKSVTQHSYFEKKPNK
jgi:hypothetical protein